MKISKKDALSWFEFFAQLPAGEQLLVKQQEIVYATFAQIEAVVIKRKEELMEQIPGLKTLKDRTLFVGPDEKFPDGCRSCLLGSGLTAIRKTNKCNLQCRFCYNYGELDAIEPVGEGIWVIGGTKFYENDIDLLLEIHKKPTGVAYVYLDLLWKSRNIIILFKNLTRLVFISIYILTALWLRKQRLKHWGRLA